MIVFAWVNDDHTVRSSGTKSNPYAVFEWMLAGGDSPVDWVALLAASRMERQALKKL